jgi:hypothetical protein
MFGWKGMQLNEIYIEVYLSLVNIPDQLVMAKTIRQQKGWLWLQKK